MNKKYIYLAVAKYSFLAAVIAVAVWWGVRLLKEVVTDSSVSIESPEAIMVTPERIAEIKSLAKWEFVKVDCEEVVDTTSRKAYIVENRLTCIYYGSVGIGVDLSRASKDWVINHGDTLNVKLPRPTVLDENFIDEARTKVFYQAGTWSNAAREAMYRKARRQMLQFALTRQNLSLAERLAKERFTSLFMSLGAKEVNVTFQ